MKKLCVLLLAVLFWGGAMRAAPVDETRTKMIASNLLKINASQLVDQTQQLGMGGMYLFVLPGEKKGNAVTHLIFHTGASVRTRYYSNYS